jgi:protein-tyrosine-phosphatase
MAAAFANHYGGDVLTAASSGLAPTQGVARNTVRSMGEMNIDVSTHVPRLYNPFEVKNYDLVVNMAGYNLPGAPPRELIEWQVSDPFGASLDVYRATRNDVEQKVMRLILDLRKRQTRR